MIANLPIPTEVAKNIYDLNAEVYAMRQVIINAAANGTPILPTDEYHMIYTTKANRLSDAQRKMMNTYFPQLNDTAASWELPYVNTTESSTMVTLRIPDDLYSVAKDIDHILWSGVVTQ